MARMTWQALSVTPYRGVAAQQALPAVLGKPDERRAAAVAEAQGLHSFTRIHFSAWR